jgi:prepilin-type N-terminal cleavage/methylation domain-containing protein
MLSLCAASLRNRARDRQLSAFTLIELIVTVTVLSLLATLAIPTFAQVRAHSRGNVAAATIAVVARAAVAQAEFGGASVTGGQLTAAANETGSISGSPLGFVVDEGTDSVAQRATTEQISGRVTGLGWALALSFDGGCAMALIADDAKVSSWYVLGNGVCSGTVATQGPGTDLPDAGEATVPSVVRDVTATPMNSTTVTVGFRAPLSNGGAPITGYRVSIIVADVVVDQRTYNPGQLSSSGGNYSVAIGNLNASTSYRFAVEAVNSAGSSTTTTPTESILTPAVLDAPAAPLNLAAEASGNSATLSWDAVEPATNEPVDGYRVYALNPSTQLYELVGATSDNTYSATGLTNGTTYTYKVSAYGDGGESSLSSPASVTPLTTPAAPLTLTATTSSQHIALTWSPVASTAAAPVTGYRIYILNPANGIYELYASSASLSLTASGLTDGTEYTFRVAAYGTAGEGPASDSVSRTPVTAPPAPTGLAAATGNATGTLTWNAVTVTSAAPVTGYRIYLMNTTSGVYELIGSTASTAYTATGLPANSTASFQVSAYGAGGEGLRASATMVTHTVTIATNPSRLGLVNYLGTKGNSITFANPHTAGMLTATQSSALGGTAVAANSVDQAASDFHTGADGSLFATYDFGTLNKVFLSGYSIRQRTGANENLLRGWVVRGSNDASNWTTLHTGSTTAGQSAWHDHSLVEADAAGYRYLRLQMTTPSSTGGSYLAYSEIEFYGSILLSVQAPVITSAVMVDGAPQLTIQQSWGATPASYEIFRNGTSVDSVPAYGVEGSVWSDTAEPAGVVSYTVKAVSAASTSAASAAAYPQVTSMPAPVVSHAGNVTIGSKVYFIGGYTGSASNSMRSYDMATGTWVTLANVPQVLWAPFAAANADGSTITVAGGYNGTSTGIGNVLVYTVATNSWQTFGGAGTTVFNSNSGTRVGNELYLFGGYENSIGDFVQSYKFNLTTRAWTRLADLPGGGQARWSVADEAGGIYVGGGIRSGTNLSTVYRYDVALNTFTQMASQPFAGRGSGAVRLPDGKIAVMGGANNALTSFNNRVDVYNPVSNTWSQLTTLPVGVLMFGAGVHNGRIHVIGGYSTTTSPYNTPTMLSFKY